MKWLNDLNPTTLKTLTGCALAVILTIYFCVASYAGRPIDSIVFGEMCVFAGTVMGIAYAGFSKQRITDYGYVEAKGLADAKVAAASGAAPDAGNDAGREIARLADGLGRSDVEGA